MHMSCAHLSALRGDRGSLALELRLLPRHLHRLQAFARCLSIQCRHNESNSNKFGNEHLHGM